MKTIECNKYSYTPEHNCITDNSCYHDNTTNTCNEHHNKRFNHCPIPNIYVHRFELIDYKLNVLTVLETYTNRTHFNRTAPFLHGLLTTLHSFCASRILQTINNIIITNLNIQDYNKSCQCIDFSATVFINIHTNYSLGIVDRSNYSCIVMLLQVR